MRIAIKDDNENWLKWGKLVNHWIDHPEQRPTNVKDLRDLLDAKGVKAEVEGADTRPVVIQSYVGSTDPLVMMLPNKKMRDDRLATIQPGPYPLPLFYDICFGGGKRVPLSGPEANDFAFRRIGEYSVNECC
jgi:hypothetical protein